MWAQATVEVGGISERVFVDFKIDVPWVPEVVEWPDKVTQGEPLLVNGATYYVEAAEPCAQRFHLTITAAAPAAAKVEAWALARAAAAAASAGPVSAGASVTVAAAKVEAPPAKPRRGRRKAK